MPRKLKNPEKYIRILKRRLEWSQKARDDNWKRLKDATGNYWFGCNFSHGFDLSSVEKARKVRIGSTVIIKGQVNSMKLIENGKVEVYFQFTDVNYTD